MEKIVLKSWSKFVGKAEYYSYKGKKLEPLNAKPSTYNGYYAKYKEGVFCVWFEDNNPLISWRGKQFNLENCTSIMWQSKLGYREFKANFKNGKHLHFRYYTVWLNFFDHVASVIFLDDDWGLDNDLPSAIDSFYSKSDFSILQNGLHNI